MVEVRLQIVRLALPGGLEACRRFGQPAEAQQRAAEAVVQFRGEVRALHAELAREANDGADRQRQRDCSGHFFPMMPPGGSAELFQSACGQHGQHRHQREAVAAGGDVDNDGQRTDDGAEPQFDRPVAPARDQSQQGQGTEHPERESEAAGLPGQQPQNGGPLAIEIYIQIAGNLPGAEVHGGLAQQASREVQRLGADIAPAGGVEIGRGGVATARAVGRGLPVDLHGGVARPQRLRDGGFRVVAEVEVVAAAAGDEAEPVGDLQPQAGHGQQRQQEDAGAHKKHSPGQPARVVPE